MVSLFKRAVSMIWSLIDLVKVMVGKELADRFPQAEGKDRVKKCSDWRIYLTMAVLRNINLDVKRGEIIGLTGLSGSGRRHLRKCYSVLMVLIEGSMVLQGKYLHIHYTPAYS